MNNKIKYDRVTQKWFDEHPGVPTTTTYCKLCALYFIPRLGHDCELRTGPAPDAFMEDGTPLYLKCSGDSSTGSLQLELYKLLAKEGSNNG